MHRWGRRAAAAPDPVPVKVAFFQECRAPGTRRGGHASSPFGWRSRTRSTAGICRSSPRSSTSTSEGTISKASELARTVAEDPSYVAAVIGPFWSEPGTVAAILDAAGIATLSLSGLGSSLAPQGWSSVAPARRGTARRVGSAGVRVPRVIASGGRHLHHGGRLELLRGGRRAAHDELGTRDIAESDVLPDDDALAGVVQRVDRAGCGIVAWSGFAPGAASCGPA